MGINQQEGIDMHHNTDIEKQAGMSRTSAQLHKCQKLCNPGAHHPGVVVALQRGASEKDATSSLL